MGRFQRRSRLAITMPLLLAAVTPPAMAQDLPAINYSVTDGLPSDEVIRVVHDPAGFLWVGTSNALARFDGKAFKTYGRNEGIDVGTGVNDIRVAANGDLWIATNGNGIFHFNLNSWNPTADVRRMTVGTGRASNRVNSFALTFDGELWAATDAGIFVGSQEADQLTRVDLPLPAGLAQDSVQATSVVLRESEVWISTNAGIHRCRSKPQRICSRVLSDIVMVMLIDSDNQLWTGGDSGVSAWRLKDGNPAGQPQKFGGGNILRMFLSSDGSVLAGTRDGRALIVHDNRADLLFDTATQTPVMEIVEDPARNVWLGTRRGLFCVRRQGVSLYSARHGLREPYVRGLFRDRHSRVYVLTEGHYLHRVEGDRLDSVRLMVPTGVSRSLWLGSTLVDANGDIWLGTEDGLFRYTNVEFTADHPREYQPSAGYTTANGLAGNHIAAIFEDRRGNLWVSNVPTGADSLAVRSVGANQFEPLGVAQGMPAFNQPMHFVDDNQGGVWAALREGGVVRIRNGAASVFGADRGFPQVTGASLLDRNGQLWFGGTGTLARVANPAADDVRAAPITSPAVGRVHALEQLVNGDIFIASDQGLLVIEGGTSDVTPHYSMSEGLPPGKVELLTRVGDHTLLLTAGRSLVRLDPAKRVRSDRQLRSVMSAVRLGGVAIPLPELGVEELNDVEVYPGRNHLEIEFVGLSPYVGEPLAYEYRLSDVSEEWQRTSDRRIAYTGLAAGRYRFEVRAARAAGGSVSPPAILNFRVLPPWYLRAWFLVLVGVGLAALIYGAHRLRLRQAIAAEQLRSRIATDLHDDLGASLSQIAVFSEVLRRRRDGMSPTETDGVLEKIGSTSRQLVASMNDIVWAVNPRQDSLGDLVARMRWFAEDMFAQSETEFEFTAPSDVNHVRIGPVAKREMLLILKESVTNIVKHARCRQAGVELNLRGHVLTLRVWDDGRGFDPDAVHQGNGIRSLRARVARLQGRLTIASAPARGSEVILAVDTR